MEVEDLKQAIEKLHTKSKIVELRYIDPGTRDKITRPGYAGRVIGEISELWGEESKHIEPPYLEFYTFLDRNQCPKGKLEISVEDIINVWPLAII